MEYILLLDDPQVGNRPSEYLRKRCPLCFGGVNWQQPEEMLVLICLMILSTDLIGSVWKQLFVLMQTLHRKEENLKERHG
jgi:hypothetical protein